MPADNRRAPGRASDPGPHLTWYGAPTPPPASDVAAASGVRPNPSPRRPDLGKRRRRIARATLTRIQRDPAWNRISSDARLTYALGLLVANDRGVVYRDDIAAAMSDPDAVACALDLLDKAGAS